LLIIIEESIVSHKARNQIKNASVIELKEKKLMNNKETEKYIYIKLL